VLSKAMMIDAMISFPEALCILLLGLSLTNIRNISRKKIVIIALLQSCIAVIVRSLGLGLGIHTIIQIVSLFVIATVITEMKWSQMIIPVLLGAFLQGSLESIIIAIVCYFKNVEPSVFLSDPINIGFCFIPVLILALAIIAVSKKMRLYLCDLND
jgi:hypothetical protein